MTTERNELVMRQLLQLAYDFSYIPTPDSEVGPHLLDLLPKVNQLTIDSLDRWFETEGREFSFEHRRKKPKGESFLSNTAERPPSAFA